MHTHLDRQTKEYGKQTLVNLVNQKGHEKPVKEAYERHVAEVRKDSFVPNVKLPLINITRQLDLPNVKYQYFDFHNECRKMRWDRISVLVDKMKDDIDKEG